MARDKSKMLADLEAKMADSATTPSECIECEKRIRKLRDEGVRTPEEIKFAEQVASIEAEPMHGTGVLETVLAPLHDVQVVGTGNGSRVAFKYGKAHIRVDLPFKLPFPL